MIQVSYAASVIVNTLEASGSDVTIVVDEVVEEASNNDVVNTDAIFVPTRAERGIIAIRDNSGGIITEAIIEDISAIQLSQTNDNPVASILGDGSGSLITINDVPDPDETIRPLIPVSYTHLTLPTIYSV